MLQKYDRGASKHIYDIVTGDESWIYAYEPENTQQSNVWVFQDEPNPTKVARTLSTFKQMIACFFGKTGHVANVPLEQRRTVNSEWYTTIYLPIVFQEIRKTNSQRDASSDMFAQTTAFLSTQNNDLMSYPPYSPDLAPNDFVLFPYLKKRLMRRFGDTSIRLAKVVRQLVQTHAKVYRSLWGIFWKAIKRFSMINICFCSLIPKYKRRPSYEHKEFLYFV